jgi:ATP-binding cassette, subfamily B, bacterial
MVAASPTEFTLYRRLLRLAQPYWPHLGGLFLLSLLASPLALLTPLPLKMAVDSVVGSHRQIPGPLAALLPAAVTRSHTALLIVAAVLFVMIGLLTQLQQLGSSVLSAYTGEKLVLDFRVRLFRHVQRLSLLYHDAKGTTDSTYRIQYDAVSIQNITVNGVFPFIAAAITIASMIYVTARIDWQLALVALAVSPVLFLVARTYRQRLRRQWGDAKKLESCAMSVVQEVLAAMRVVKAFGQEHYEQERFICQSSKGLRSRVHLAFVAGSFGLLVGLLTAVGTAAVLFMGMRHVQTGVLTLGELLVVMSYLAQLYLPLQTISKKAADLQASLASAERAFALLDEGADVTERPNARPLARALGTVAFRKVCFAYSTDHPVLHDISFEIGPGTHLGIAGTTGAGKTTLVSLLSRFYDPTAGQILLDGVDLRDYKLADLRNQFAIVLQEPVLFSSSIAENIAYARPGASDHEIMAAAKAANAHEFIVGLPQGYETLVGERGMRLSGGERQRISLARAFLKDAPILILDEPTSSVDTKTEAAIMEAMKRLMYGRTTFMIAHRLSTLANCDVLLQIEQGRLVQATLATLRADKEAEAFGGHDTACYGSIGYAKRRATFRDGRIVSAEPIATSRSVEANSSPIQSEEAQDSEPQLEASAEETAILNTNRMKRQPAKPLVSQETVQRPVTVPLQKEPLRPESPASSSQQPSQIHRFKVSVLPPLIRLALFVTLLTSAGIGMGLWLYTANHHTTGSTFPLSVGQQKVTSHPTASTVAHATSTTVPGSSTYPKLAGAYAGTIHDIPTSTTTNLSLTGIQQRQGNISGYFGAKGNRLFNGLPQSGPFTGTITTPKQIQFIVTDDRGQATFSFDGFIQPDGTIGGTYCSLEVVTGKCSDYGVWSISPTQS